MAMADVEPVALAAFGALAALEVAQASQAREAVESAAPSLPAESAATRLQRLARRRIAESQRAAEERLAAAAAEAAAAEAAAQSQAEGEWMPPQSDGAADSWWLEEAEGRPLEDGTTMSYLEVLEEEARSQRLRLHIEHQLLRQEENRQLLVESRCGICLCDFSEVEETATICQLGCHHTHAFCAGCLRSPAPLELG